MRLIGCEWKWRKSWSDAVLIGRGLSLDFTKKHDQRREPSELLLCSFERTGSQRFSGDSCEDTPVPMPNTVVKLTNAESTWLEAAREDRKLLIKKKALTVMVSAFLLCVSFEMMGFCEESALTGIPEG